MGLTWIALVWLGLVGSCLAYLLYYYLIHSIGPTRASMVTYTFPIVGITLGVFVLPLLGYPAEMLDINLIAGAVLIISSLLIVNRRPTVAPKPA